MHSNPLIKQFCNEYMEGNDFNPLNFEKYNKPIYENIIVDDMISLKHIFDKFLTLSFNDCNKVAINDFIKRFSYIVVYDNFVFTSENNIHVSGETPLMYLLTGNVKTIPLSDLKEISEIVTYHHRFPYYNPLIKDLVCQLPSEFKDDQYYYSSNYIGSSENFHDKITVKTKIYIRK